MWYPVTKSVGNVHYDKEDCVEELNGIASSNVKSDITKFFQPVSHPKPDPSLKQSRFFSPQQATIPLDSQQQAHRNFDEEVEEIPDEVFDWPEVQMGDSSRMPIQTPPQTVPQQPSKQPAIQQPVTTQPSPIQTVPPSPNQSVPQQQQSPTQTVPLTPQQDSAQETPTNDTSPPSHKHQLTRCKRKLEFEPVPDAKKMHS